MQENTVNRQELETVGADAQVADASNKSERELYLEKELAKVDIKLLSKF